MCPSSVKDYDDMPQLCISYAIDLYLICDRFPYYMLQLSVLYATAFCTICYSFLYYMPQLSVLYATAFCTICHSFPYYIVQISISYAIHFYLICVTFHLICRRNMYSMFKDFIPLPWVCCNITEAWHCLFITRTRHTLCKE